MAIEQATKTGASKDTISAAWNKYNATVTAILTEHGSGGAHGAITATSLATTTITALTSLTAAGNLDIGAYSFRAQNLIADALTSGRVVLTTTNGQLTTDSDITFATDTLTVTKIGAFTAAGAIDFDSQNMTNVDIDSGTIDGVTIGGVTIDAAIAVNDDILFGLGTNSDGVLLNRSTSLTANTALAGVFVGTPIVPALAANSLVMSNITADGDIILATQTGTNSQANVFIDASAGSTHILAAGVSNLNVALGRVNIYDDIILQLGTGGDQALLNRSTSLTANTALGNVLIGTPVTPALAANSLIVSNITEDGDILIAGNDGGASKASLFFDASAYKTYLYDEVVLGAAKLTVGATTPTAAQWGYVGGMNQSVATSDNVSFQDITAADDKDIKFTSGAKIERSDGNLVLTPESGKAVYSRFLIESFDTTVATTSVSTVDAQLTNGTDGDIELTITPAVTSSLIVMATGYGSNDTATKYVKCEIRLDDAGKNILTYIVSTDANEVGNYSVMGIITGVSAAEHKVNVWGKVNAGTGTWNVISLRAIAIAE